MANDVALRDLCELIVDCPHSTPKWTDSGVLVLRSNNIRGGRLDLSHRSFTDEANYRQRSRRAELRGGDLVITREAPMGEVCMVPDGLRCCLGQRMVLLRPDNNKCDGRYLLYAIQSPSVQNQISWSEGTGSTVSNLRIPHLAALRVSTPSLPEQRAIAAVLGTLDDKIERNRETGVALEELARATFKAWFVDFEPVRAKAAGAVGFPGMPPAAFAALSDRLTDSQLGPVPQGWEPATVADICTRITSGGTPKTDESRYWGGSLRWLSSGETGSTYIIDTEKKITDAGATESSTRLVRAGCTVIASAGQGKTRGQTSLLFVDCYINQSVLALEANARASDSFLFLCMKPQYEELRRISDAHSSRGSLTKQLVGGINLTMPPQAVVKSFDAIVSPMFDMIRSLTMESEKLATLRDYLLPRLLSGRVRVRDVVESGIGA